MRGKRMFLPALAALLVLSGCARTAEEMPVTVVLPAGESAAAFTGSVRSGAGEGVLRFADWLYQGTFWENGALIAGEAGNYPWTLVIAGTELPGRYTGALEEGRPVGEGRFRADNGAVFTGRMQGEAAVLGAAEHLPYTLLWAGSRYAGTYDGALENGLPAGEGTFRGANAAGQALTWEGGWTAGEMTGPGSLTADRLVTEVEGREQMGAYTGAAESGVPEGEGEFRSVDAEGVAYTYTGTWKDGRMDGAGELRYAAADRFVRIGTFTAGRFTPTWVEALSVLGTAEPAFTLSQAQTDFLNAHPELWEAESRMDFYNSEYNQTLDRVYRLRKCFQEPETMDEPRWLLQYSLKILNVHFGPAFPGGPDITRVTAVDDSYEMVVYILVPGQAEGAASNRRISLIGLPLQLSTYTTVLGEENTCLVMVAGDVMISG